MYRFEINDMYILWWQNYLFYRFSKWDEYCRFIRLLVAYYYEYKLSKTCVQQIKLYFSRKIKSVSKDLSTVHDTIGAYFVFYLGSFYCLFKPIILLNWVCWKISIFLLMYFSLPFRSKVMERIEEKKKNQIKDGVLGPRRNITQGNVSYTSKKKQKFIKISEMKLDNFHLLLSSSLLLI